MMKYLNNLKFIINFKYSTFFYLVSLFVILTFLEVLSISIIYPFIKFILSGELVFFEKIFKYLGLDSKRLLFVV